MTISIDPLTYVIHIPRNDLGIVQLYPTEIRNMDLNWFKLQLGDLLDDPLGMPLPKAFTHNTEVVLGGLTYARIIEILDPYTVTFEDGQYAVNLIGANSNVADKTNVNQVSVRPQNSAGLISSADIEYTSFDGGVTLDTINGFPGTGLIASGAHIGTPRAPSNNMHDAKDIAVYRGLTKIYVVHDMTLPAYDRDGITPFSLTGYSFYGSGKDTTTAFIPSAADISVCKYFDMHVAGTLDGFNTLRDCLIDNLVYIKGFIEECVLAPGIITLGGGDPSSFLNCFSGVPSGTAIEGRVPVIDVAGDGQELIMRNYNGAVKLTNKTGPEISSIDLNSGQVIIDLNTVTDGEVIIRGIGEVQDQNGNELRSGWYGDLKVTNDSMNRANMSEAVWDEPIEEHLIPGTTGHSVGIAQFGGAVHLNCLNGGTGTVFPMGTEENPVNNFDDALLISAINGINDIFLHTSCPIPADINVSGKTLKGEIRSTITLEDGCTTMGTSFDSLRLAGVFGGKVRLDRCVIDDTGVDQFYGFMDTCTFNGPVGLSSNNTHNAVFFDCLSGDVGGPPVINCNGDGAKLSFRGLTGAAFITNKTGSTQPIFFDIYSARIGFSSTVVDANITVRGVGYIYQNDSVNTTFNNTGLMSKNTVSEAVWDEPISEHLIEGSSGFSVGIEQFSGVVTIDTINGLIGTAYPIGTTKFPVKTISDALVIADVRGLKTLDFHSSAIIPSGSNIENFLIMSHDWQEITIEPGVLQDNTVYSKVSLYGELGGFWNALEDCWIYDITNFCGWVRDGSFSSIQLAPWNEDSNGESFFDDIKPMAPGVSSVLVMNTDVSVSFTGSTDITTITSMTSGSILIHELLGGEVTIDSSCSGGDITITGAGILVNNSTLDVNTEGLISQDTVSKAVWDEPISGHLIPGTTGLSVGIDQFEGVVTIDTVNGVSGTNFPIGTAGNPVDNIDDAKVIANSRGITTLYFINNYTFLGTDVLDGYILKGLDRERVILTFTAGVSTIGCRILNATATGATAGIIGFENTVIQDLGSVSIIPSSQDIVLQNCGLAGINSIPTDYSGTLLVLNSWMESESSITSFNMNNSNASLVLRNYSGGFKLVEVTQGNNIDIDLYSGIIELDTTVTSANVTIRGVGELIDNSGPGTTVNISGLMSKDTVSEAVWDEPIVDHMIPDTIGHQMYHMAYDGIVEVDVINGISGVAYPTGTSHQPCNNLSDALTIANIHFFKTIHVRGYLTIDGEDITGYTIGADSSVGNVVTITSMINTDTVYFEDITVSGNLSGATRFTTCVIGTLTGFDGGAKNCLITGDIGITGSGANYLTDCDAYVNDIDTYIDISVSDKKLNIIKGRGNFQISDKNSAVNDTYIDLVAGQVRVDASCVLGTIKVDGIAYVVDNSGINCTVDVENAVDSRYIADKVWDELLVDHQIEGSYGNELATKADLEAQVQLSQSVAVSGSVINGAEVTGDFTYTNIKDSVAWEIAETATGIDVELVFNLPNENHKPNSIKTYGYYIGTPSTTHYIELWAWNYDANGWELLHEEFLPGGNTQINEYTHDYYERNVDRNNNNEVTIRFLHNPTTYNTNHRMYLDSVEVSSVEVRTVNEIANAVWEHPTGTSVSTGVEFMKNIEGGRWHIVGTQMIFYADDNVTEIARFNLLDGTETPNADIVFQRVRV